MSEGFFDEYICPRCKKLTSFVPSGVLDIETAVLQTAPGAVRHIRVSAVRYNCQNPKCQRYVVVLEMDGHPQIQLYPATGATRSLDSEAPAGIADAFAEASQCQGIGAMRAAGVMYRMALELICDEKGIPRNGKNASGGSYFSLANRVPDLAAKGLPQDLVDNMHEVRLVGNDSVHEGIAFSVEELDDVAGMIEEAVEVLWVQPARRAAMKAARDARRNGAAPASTTPTAPRSPATQSTTVV